MIHRDRKEEENDQKEVIMCISRSCTCDYNSGLRNKLGEHIGEHSNLFRR